MRRTGGSDGYVTLAVLLTAALLAAVVAGLVAVSRPALGLARIGVDEVAAEALLDGGLASAAFLLYQAQRDAAGVNGLTLRRETGEVSLNVVDESARIDINAARPELLRGLYIAIEGTSMSPEAFAGRVVDWRDEDDEVSPDGAETADYETEDLGYVAPNRPFRSVDELRYLLGLSRADFSRLAPFVTVYSGLGTVDPLSASETVLTAIPGINPPTLDLVLRAREQGLDRERIRTLVQRGSEFLSTAPSTVYRVEVQARLRNGFTDAAVAIIMAPSPQGGADYRVAAWWRLSAVATQ